ncbi:MAG: glycosyltransferase family 2 protein [Deltaproteobacteria bacterium]|nr:glycosyltransferase family 2 protein [Deltaproteobacteria bacterium]
MEGLTVIIPAYNEEGSLRKCVHETHVFLSAAMEDFELIIVDDGSTDNTWDIARELSRAFKNVSAERHKTNMGIGAAIRTGIEASKRELVFYLPADNQMDIRELPLFLKAIRDADIIAGRRVNRVVGLKRLMLSKIYNRMFSLIYGITVHDIGWVKFMRRSTAQSLKLTSESASIDVEILVKAKRLGLNVKEVQVHEMPRTAGAAKGAKMLRVLKLFFDVLLIKKTV